MELISRVFGPNCDYVRGLRFGMTRSKMSISTQKNKLLLLLKENATTNVICRRVEKCDSFLTKG